MSDHGSAGSTSFRYPGVKGGDWWHKPVVFLDRDDCRWTNSSRALAQPRSIARGTLPLTPLGRAHSRVLSLAALCLGLLRLGIGAARDVRAAAGEVRVLTIDGVINPISARYVLRGIEA